MHEGKGQGAEPQATQDEQPLGALRDHVPTELLDVSFPVAVRGYDRRAVDAYVKRVNRVIAEIKVTASPRAAVKHALQETERQVSGLLERARETADEITTSAQREAEAEAGKTNAKAAELLVNTHAEAEAIKKEADTELADARAEAEKIRAESQQQAQRTVAEAEAVAKERRAKLEIELTSRQEQAEARMQMIESDTTAVEERRGQLLVEIRGTASKLVDLADVAAAVGSPEPELLEALEPRTDQQEPAEEPDEVSAEDTVVKQKPTAKHRRRGSARAR
jgi:DivIVA domain-containing protein